MKLKTILLTVSLVSALTSLAQASESGELLFDAKCASCHIKTQPSDFSKLVAPPVMGVMRHVKMKYENKEDAVKFISEYALNPQREKAVCMPQKIKRFGLMPSQKGSVTQAELATIANWMYDNFPSANFQGRVSGQGCKAKKAQAPRANMPQSSSPFLITSGMPHMTKLVKQNWDNPLLNLSKAQKEKLLVVRKATMQSIMRIKPQVKKLEKKIIAMTMAGESPKKLNPMAEQLAQLKAEATKVHIRCIYDTSNILTKKQVEFLSK